MRQVYAMSQAKFLDRRLEELGREIKEPDWNALLSEAYDVINNMEGNHGLLEIEGAMVFLLVDGEFYVHGTDIQTLTNTANNFYKQLNELGEFAGRSYTNDLLEFKSGMSYTKGDDGVLLAWYSFGGDKNRIGMYVPNTEALRMSEGLRELMDSETSKTIKNMTKTAQQSALIVALAIAALLVALPLASRHLALAVVNPVEQEQQRQRDLLRIAEEEKVMLERLDRLKTEFLSNVSHELKTPLTVVSGHAQLLGAQLDEPEYAAARDKSRIISSEADRLALMVGQVLDVTRIEEGGMPLERHSCHIDELIYQAVETHFPILNKGENRLEINVDIDLPKVNVDPGRITQVLVNLIANALRHTVQGVITVSAREANGFMEISVSDTGTGMAAEELSGLFTRFRPGKGETGTGLGLYICKYLVEEHGGAIRVESVVDKGTNVTFSLPL